MLTFRIVAFSCAMLLAIASASIAHSQDYPSKAVRIIGPAPGGGGDFLARLVAQGISSPLGQPVIVENRPSGLLATEAVSRASPDGYTLLLTGSSFWIIPLLQNAPYKDADFAPLSLLAREVNVLAVHPSLPVKSVGQLIALAKARPGALNFSASTVGSPGHLAGELFKSMAGVNMVGVPYKGTALGIASLLSGEVQLVIADSGLIVPHAKSGKVRALAVTTAQPSPLVPGLPTVAASGLAGFEWIAATGMWAPAKTPIPILNRLNQEIVRLLSRTDVKDRLFNVGVESVGTSSEEFYTLIQTDMARVGKVVKDAGIKVN